MDARSLALFCATALLLLAHEARAAVCPPSCVCSTTPDGLHKATCSNQHDFEKFLRNKKHHNINILDISHNNITRLTLDFERLTELVSLDLSTNGFSTVSSDSFPRYSTKLVHINMANNRISRLSLSYLPESISSIDLSYNLLTDIPNDISSLPSLEHIQLEGNPINCSCHNMLLRDHLLVNGISIDSLRCASPRRYRGVIWFDVKTKDACKYSDPSVKIHKLVSPEVISNQVAHDSFMLKFKPSQALTDLDEGQTWVGHAQHDEGDDETVFLRAKRHEPVDNIEGSGNNDIGRESHYTTDSSLSLSQMEDEQVLQNNGIASEDGLEGSGEGSGFGIIKDNPEREQDEYENDTVTPVTEVKELYTNHVDPFLGNGVVDEDTEIPDEIMPERPKVYMGPEDWYNTSTTTTTTTEVAAGAEKIQIEKNLSEQTAETKGEEKPAVYRTGTYVCVAIIIILLVGLIGFALVKGQLRRRRDRRLQRQQKRDVEVASKEMIDMNTSLLGKPAPKVMIGETRANGKYELVPTHETLPKKGENGNVTNDASKSKGSPRDSNQNREERPRSMNPLDDVSPSAAYNSPRKERGSLSSDEIFVPESDEGLLSNGATPSDATATLMNGSNTADVDYLSPSREYVPVYSPDMGRVRIKLTETPKPKTPVLVNRSRSNAGDIIVTPSIGQSFPKSAT